MNKRKIILILACIFLLVGCSSNEKMWYENFMIAHAGGGIDGKTMTNSLESLDLAASNGYKLIEIDFQLTSDDVLVLKHDWHKSSAITLEMPTGEGDIYIPDCATFKTWKVYRKYTTMTAAELIEWMKKHTDIYIVVDSKDTDKEIVQKQYSQIVELCGNDKDVLDRFIVQI